MRLLVLVALYVVGPSVAVRERGMPVLVTALVGLPQAGMLLGVQCLPSEDPEVVLEES